MKNFLKTASPELLKKLNEYGRPKIFAENARVFSEGEAAEFLPLILSGKIKMMRFPEVGREIIIGIFSDGDIFAIPPVFDGTPYPASAVAMEKTKLLLVKREDFLTLLSESQEFSNVVMTRMCGILREKTETIQNLTIASPERRIAKVLLQLSEKEKAEMPVKITLRRQDIAEMAGLTTETTIRAVKKLAAKNLFGIVHGKIVFDELDSLRKFVKNKST